MRKIRTVERQSVIDIALQEYGSTDAALQLLRDNPGVTRIDQVLAPGTVLNISDVVYNRNTTTFFSARKKQLVSLTHSEVSQSGDFNNDFNQDFS